MNARRRIARRHLLLAPVVLLAAWPGPWSMAPFPNANAVAEDVVAELFKDRTSVRAVGQAYLAIAGPEEQSPERVLGALFAAHNADWRRGEPAGDIASRIRSWVGRDFAEGAIVTIDGWMISRTEARLSALAALLT